MSVADRGQCGAEPGTRIAAAIFRYNQNVRIVLRQGGDDRRQPLAAALPDIPGEQPQGPHSPPSLPAPRRPLTSAPASGDIRRKNGTDNTEIAPTTASANEKSAALDTSRPCVDSITYSSNAPVPTPTLCDNCWAILVRLVARLNMPGGTSA